MLLDLNRSSQSLHANICVIGGGAVGIAIAVSLARSGTKVVLLEAGGLDFEEASQELVTGSSIGHRFYNLDTARFRLLGGGTRVWGGQMTTFDTSIFRPRHWAKSPGWPLRPEELDEYYTRAYKLLGMDDIEPEDNIIWRKFGLKPPPLHEGVEIFLTRWMPVRNFARLFKRDLRCPNGPTVILHANLKSFSTTENGERITVAHAESLSGNVLAVTADSFVLACGTLEISRLLQQPGITDKRAPWLSNHWLGRGFIDHIDGRGGLIKILNRRKFHDLFDPMYIGRNRYYPKLKLKSSYQEVNQLLSISANFIFHSSLDREINAIREFSSSLKRWQIPRKRIEVIKSIWTTMSYSAPVFARYITAQRFYRPSDVKVEMRLYSEQIPLFESRVALSSERDRLGHFAVALDWRIDGREMKTFCRFGRLVKQALFFNQLADVELDPKLDREDPEFFSDVSDSLHHMSGARMGRDAGEAVVDRNLRVFGTENLYVCGAAVFPSSGYGNPTFTAVALGVRLAEHLRTRVFH